MRLRKLFTLSLAGRVLLVAALVGAVMMALAALFLFQNARSAIALETEAARRIARDYSIALMGTLLRDNKPEQALAMLPNIMAQPRHVTIAVFDNARGLYHLPAPQASQEHETAPAWFAALLRPNPVEVQIPVRIGNTSYGQIIVTPDPADEINEIWEDFVTLTILGSIAYLVGLLALTVIVRAALRPLERMAGAFDQLESGDYGVRIKPVGVPELESLAGRFNRLAAALSATMAEKDALNRSLVSVQDAERKAIALELHDELGPCLFGLRVEAKAILDRAKRGGDELAAENVASMLDIVEQIQRTNRALLARLRPMEIGQLPLDRALQDLVARLHPMGGDIAWHVDIAPDLGRHDETSEITVYRLLQEALTNALRHARAANIWVKVGLSGDPFEAVEVVVTDDGCGGASAMSSSGRGLRGMQERIGGVGGSLAIEERDGGGTVVRALVPVVAEGRMLVDEAVA